MLNFIIWLLVLGRWIYIRIYISEALLCAPPETRHQLVHIILRFWRQSGTEFLPVQPLPHQSKLRTLYTDTLIIHRMLMVLSVKVPSQVYLTGRIHDKCQLIFMKALHGETFFAIHPKFLKYCPVYNACYTCTQYSNIRLCVIFVVSHKLENTSCSLYLTCKI